jgi:polysaccharide export outer membrane protein
MKKILFLLIITFSISYAQDVKIGAPENKFNTAGGFYDYSDPRYVNIMVNIWGYVRFPGKYYVPEQSKLIDLISYAGGPTPDAFLDDIRLYRTDENGKTIFQKFNIEQLMYGKVKDPSLENIPKLKAGDIVMIPGEPKLYFRDYTSIITSLISVSVSLIILILNITRK